METRVKLVRINFLVCTLINFLILPILLIMFVYQQIVNLCLKIVYWKQYAGLMKTWDALSFLAEHPEAPNIPFIVFEIEANKCDVNGMDQTLLQTVREGFDRSIKNNKHLEKLTYSKHAKFGYAFWMKMKNFDIKNHVKRIELKEGQTVEEYYQKIVSKNVPGIWEILICDKVSGKDGKLYLILNFHHALGDVLSILQMLKICIFTSKPTTNKIVLPNPVSKLRTAFMIWMWPNYKLRNLIFLKNTNIIHPPTLSHNKGVVWAFDENDAVLKVKYVKKWIPGLTFMGVVHTALSVALYKYIEKYMGKEKVPEFIYMDTVKELPGTVFDEKIPEKIKLKTSLGFDALFLRLVSPDLPAKEKLETVCKDLLESEPGEDLVNYISTKIGYPLICPIPMGQSCRSTIATSNFPGFPQLYLDGRKITNVAFAPNHLFNLGLTMGINSYGDNLNFALIFDKSVIQTEDQGKEILNNMYEEIEDMYSCASWKI